MTVVPTHWASSGGAIGSSLQGSPEGETSWRPVEDKMSPILSALLSMAEDSHHQESLQREILLPICYVRAEHSQQNGNYISWGGTDNIFLISNVAIFVLRFLAISVDLFFLITKTVCIELTELSYPGTKSAQLKIRYS